MPFANNQGVRIHYQVEGSGPALIIHHGFSDSLETWYECGYVEPLKHDYRLILIDARGHGDSDKPHDAAAYDMKLMGGDVTAVLDDLHLSTAHYFGYSMGGRIGWNLAKYAPERLHSLVIGGAHPYEDRMDGMRQFLQKGIKDGREAFVSAIEQSVGSLPPAQKARAQSNDLEALLACAQDRPSLEAVLPTMTMPCLLFVGETDGRYPQVRACEQQMPDVTFFSLPGLAHPEARVRSELVLPHITKFLATVHEA